MYPAGSLRRRLSKALGSDITQLSLEDLSHACDQALSNYLSIVSFSHLSPNHLVLPSLQEAIKLGSIAAVEALLSQAQACVCLGEEDANKLYLAASSMKLPPSQRSLMLKHLVSALKPVGRLQALCLAAGPLSDKELMLWILCFGGSEDGWTYEEVAAAVYSAVQHKSLETLEELLRQPGWDWEEEEGHLQRALACAVMDTAPPAAAAGEAEQRPKPPAAAAAGEEEAYKEGPADSPSAAGAAANEAPSPALADKKKQVLEIILDVMAWSKASLVESLCMTSSSATAALLLQACPRDGEWVADDLSPVLTAAAGAERLKVVQLLLYKPALQWTKKHLADALAAAAASEVQMPPPSAAAKGVVTRDVASRAGMVVEVLLDILPRWSKQALVSAISKASSPGIARQLLRAGGTWEADELAVALAAVAGAGQVHVLSVVMCFSGVVWLEKHLAPALAAAAGISDMLCLSNAGPDSSLAVVHTLLAVPPQRWRTCSIAAALCHAGSAAVAEALLAADVLPDPLGAGDLRAPLAAAAKAGRGAVVQLLLEVPGVSWRMEQLGDALTAAAGSREARRYHLNGKHIVTAIASALKEKWGKAMLRAALDAACACEVVDAKAVTKLLSTPVDQPWTAHELAPLVTALAASAVSAVGCSQSWLSVLKVMLNTPGVQWQTSDLVEAMDSAAGYNPWASGTGMPDAGLVGNSKAAVKLLLGAAEGWTKGVLLARVKRARNDGALGRLLEACPEPWSCFDLLNSLRSWVLAGNRCMVCLLLNAHRVRWKRLPDDVVPHDLIVKVLQQLRQRGWGYEIVQLLLSKLPIMQEMLWPDLYAAVRAEDVWLLGNLLSLQPEQVPWCEGMISMVLYAAIEAAVAAAEFSPTTEAMVRLLLHALPDCKDKLHYLLLFKLAGQPQLARQLLRVMPQPLQPGELGSIVAGAVEGGNLQLLQMLLQLQGVQWSAADLQEALLAAAAGAGKSAVLLLVLDAVPMWSKSVLLAAIAKTHNPVIAQLLLARGPEVWSAQELKLAWLAVEFLREQRRIVGFTDT